MILEEDHNYLNFLSRTLKLEHILKMCVCICVLDKRKGKKIIPANETFLFSNKSGSCNPGCIQGFEKERPRVAKRTNTIVANMLSRLMLRAEECGIGFLAVEVE